MRQYPNIEDEYDAKELAVLKAEEWQLEMLKKNPEYVHWGNHEDYMADKDKGWAERVFLDSFKGVWNLDELNELVNFYFLIERKNHQCPACEGNDLNKATFQLSEDWYDFNKTGRKWCHNISSVEIEALVRSGRINELVDPTPTKEDANITTTRCWFDEKENIWQGWATINGENKVVEVVEPKYPSAEKVNNWSAGKGMGHDAINRWICVEARAKHQGVYGKCESKDCEGGHVYDEDKAILKLQLWYLHPRKGCSRGVLVEKIEQDEIPAVIDYLKEAANRNQERFSKL